MDWIKKLGGVKKRVYSQSGEDGIIEEIFKNIGVTNRRYVEFGAGDGVCLSNTRYLLRLGWSGSLWDIEPKHPRVAREEITAENINAIFEKYKVPQDLDLLSIDIDGNDYWVWKALTWRPRVVVIEINPSIPLGQRLAIKYDPNIRFAKTDYYGASLSALRALGVEKGYSLVYVIRSLNAFFVRSDIIPDQNLPVTFEVRQAWPKDKLKREWVKV